MKISKDTMEVLKNFAAFNTSIYIKPGSELKTITATKTAMVIATVKESFPTEAGIYDLNQFLATMSLFEDPDLDFGDKAVQISDKNGSVASYSYADKSTLTSVTDRKIQLPSIDVTFKIPYSNISGAIKAASVMGLSHIALAGRNGKIYVQAIDAENRTANNWERPVGEASVSDFRVIFKLEMLKFLPNDYDVELSKKMIAKFGAKDITYYVAAETGSSFSA